MAKMSFLVRYCLRSAGEDLRASTTLVNGGHYRHAMFFCQLALEKALKAVLQHQTAVLPPQFHDLRMLVARTGLTLPARLKRFLDRMAGLSVPTRYPGPLSTMRLGFRKDRVERSIQQAEKVLVWCRHHCR